MDRGKRRWHSCTPRRGLLRYKGHIWRGNKQIDIVKRFYGTRAPMLGPRLQPSLNGVSTPESQRAHSNRFPDRSWFRGHLKLANRLHRTLRRVCRITQFFMQSRVKYLWQQVPVPPIESLMIVMHDVSHHIGCVIFRLVPIELIQERARRRWRLISADTDFVSRCDNSATFGRRLMVIIARRAIQVSPPSSNDLRADRRYRNFSYTLRSTNERHALSSFTRFSSCIMRFELILNEPANELGHTRWFYWRTSKQGACSASWLLAEWNYFTTRANGKISPLVYRLALRH